MKGLTMNRLALAGLRANRKEYRQMALGIFLAVFLAVGTALGLWTIWEKQAAVRRIRFGQADGLLGIVQPKQGLVPLGNGRMAHGKYSLFLLVFRAVPGIRQAAARFFFQ